MTTHTSDLERDRALRDLLDAIDTACERLTDTSENLTDPEAMRDAMYSAGDVLAAAAGYLQELRDEQLRGRAA
jgi:hypothetical protein